MIINNTKLSGNTFENHNIEDYDYFNILLRDATLESYETVYLGTLLKTLRVKKNESIELPVIERKVIEAGEEETYDKYYIFNKWIYEDFNEFTSNDLVNSNKLLCAEYNYIFVPKVINIQIINNEQSMMNSFTIRSSIQIFANETYIIDETRIVVNLKSVFNNLTKEYENTITISCDELENFEGNVFELTGSIQLFDDSNKSNLNSDLLVNLNLNFYRSDTSTGD